jgi:hypothetical protein
MRACGGVPSHTLLSMSRTALFVAIERWAVWEVDVLQRCLHSEDPLNRPPRTRNRHRACNLTVPSRRTRKSAPKPDR